MANFLSTDGISHHLSEIIKNPSGGRLLLISPYLKFSRRIREQLEYQDMLKRDIRVVYGKSELSPEESEWLSSTKIRTSFREPLHAKCYMNDSHALITSMNLYEFSQRNNDEMGILVSIEDDSELYQSIKEEAERILRLSEEVELRVKRVEDGVDAPPWGDNIFAPSVDYPVQSEPQRAPTSPPQHTTLPELGFCLRCRTEIPLVLDKPYCNSHYRTWARFKNADYEEDYCHTCGAEHDTSMAKPLCLSCFRKYRSAFRTAS